MVFYIVFHQPIVSFIYFWDGNKFDVTSDVVLRPEVQHPLSFFALAPPLIRGYVRYRTDRRWFSS